MPAPLHLDCWWPMTALCWTTGSVARSTSGKVCGCLLLLRVVGNTNASMCDPWNSTPYPEYCGCSPGGPKPLSGVTASPPSTAGETLPHRSQVSFRKHFFCVWLGSSTVPTVFVPGSGFKSSVTQKKACWNRGGDPPTPDSDSLG